MTDPDRSTAAALRLLHHPETDPAALDRRRFLQLVGMGLGAGLVAGPGTSLLDTALTGHDPAAWAAGPIGPDDGVLVVIGLYGGNDGLNTVVPFDDGHYHDQHGPLAIAGAQTLPLDAHCGLHPALTELKRRWDDGDLAIVEGVGSPNPNLSHFSAMAQWMSGTTSGVPSTGWIGRWLDGYLGGSTDHFAAAEIGYSVPLHMVGRVARGSVVPAGRPRFGVAESEHDAHRFATIRALNSAPIDTWLGRVGQAMEEQLDVAAALAPVIPDELPERRIVARLEVIARLINANLGFRVLTAGHGDFDHHAGQPDQHPVLMGELNAALARFFELLDPAWAGRVTVMTYSEFGRTSWGNDGRGTDHGTAAPHFVIGAGVRGGFYGQRPSLAGLGRWDRMAHHVDFRDYFGSVIDGWLGGGASEVFGGRAIDDLGLFAGSPSAGGGGSGGSSSPVALGDFVAIRPARVRDSRNGIGGSATPIGAGQVVDVRVAGVGGVPYDGVTAVAVNVTSVNASQPTYFTVFPTGTPRPDTSSLNPVPGRAVPNMTVVGVGAGGTISIFNHSGSADYLVDVLGYFRTEPGSRLAPLRPARLLDTRVGTGAPQAKVRGGRHLDLVVAGRGGVPAGADAVVLNVTAVEPSADGYVTVWPHGSARPNVSALNYVAGMVIPNLVVCKVGTGGAVSLFASDGEVDLLADVVGYFGGSGSRHVGIRPARILDTRNGIGAARRRVGRGGEIDLAVGGRGGVPADATAAILNVTVVGASNSTFVTTYPNGQPRPNASSHNAAPGQTVANLSVAKLGTGGRVRLFNAFGEVDLIADVTGYFS